ncbi:hydrolase [Bacillus sp. FJAT-29790]|uniref:hydrolase n=1 Tax=Bacillus sp. FJAT-29790 TaxID=1895002 RepID=UPI001C223E2D|nr:hydrolase [Bacillus sp. FJAT-29790]MBU8877453.1 hydrolase [Bacillus sp. FJAT-29790]
MESRNFQLDNEWNTIQYPEKPSGFGILIIGNERHFVNEKADYWSQNDGKSFILNQLKEEGYTIFYSNLYGKHWGNDKAVQLARKLYKHIVRTEIINEKIHLVAEGMGTLIALKLMNAMGSNIRTCVLINPILSLNAHLEQEKEHKFFYNHLLKELAVSFELEKDQIEDMLKGQDESLIEDHKIPVKIIHILTDGRAHKQADLIKKRSIKWADKDVPVSMCYLLPEKRHGMGIQIINFIKKHESIL